MNYYKEQTGLIRRQTVFKKAAWPQGPWDDEPDRIAWRDSETGRHCLMKRNGYGAWCGYVGVEPGHPLYKKGYDVKGVYMLDVHGGITYADECDERRDENGCEIGICHTPPPGEPDAIWWLGFDCNHGCDDAPGNDFFDGTSRLEAYRDVEYVKNEVRQLARQLGPAPKGKN